MKLLVSGLASLALTSAASVAINAVNYDGYKVYRVGVGEKVDEIKSIIDNMKLASWVGAPKANAVIDLVVPPGVVNTFEKATTGFSTEIMHENLAESISAESNYDVYAAGSANDTWFDSYHSIDDHVQFIKDLAAAYPNNAEIFSAGKSNSGRDIPGIHIWGSGGKDSKKAILWHGTVHAREWITTLTVEYAAYTLLTKYASDSTIKGYVDAYDYYIIPIVNPDGFAYTQTNDRMWRKNRQTTSSASCVGRDINRNWPNKWDVAGGASTSPCAEDYKGPSAGDGTETKALAAHMNSLVSKNGIRMYLDFHSYSQLFMYPYGYTCFGTLPNSSTYKSLASGAVAAIKAVHGTSFQAGPICTTIYQVSGDSVDYAYEVAKVDYSFTVELRDTGNYGFVLPANQIRPSAEEMWAGLAYLLANMK